MEERDCLIGLAPKYDAKETARQAAIEALQQRRFLDANDCIQAYVALCLRPDEELNVPFSVTYLNGDCEVSAWFFSRKNAERFAAHVDSVVTEGE